MSADLLRQAAALMRERAKAARAGRWQSTDGDVWADWPSQPRPVAVCSGSHVPRGNHINAEHIASWQPLVALAVADWLDDEYAIWARSATSLSAWSMHAMAGTTNAPPPGALAVARAYLGVDQ